IAVVKVLKWVQITKCGNGSSGVVSRKSQFLNSIPWMSVDGNSYGNPDPAGFGGIKGKIG
ncbi:hypothetical protein CR513_43936, partial [Mucuna pruriens]